MRYLRSIMCTMLVLIAACGTSHEKSTDIPKPLPASKNINTLEEIPVPESGPNYTAAGFNVQLGVAYLRQGDLPRAKHKLLRAVEQAPSWPPALDAMAFYLEKTGDTQQAEAFYRNALHTGTQTYIGSAQNNYGTFLCRQGRYDEANRYFLLAANNEEYLNTAEAYENAGICALDNKKLNDAEQYFLSAIKQDNKRTTSYLDLGEIAFQQQKYSNAHRYLQQYLALAKPSASSLWLGIRLARERGDWNTASSYGLLLKEKFPGSKEYATYQSTERG